jgi:hydroxyacylglutathione hydrolase
MISIKVFTFNPVQENTYVLSDEKDACCIIDPGCYFDHERAELEKFVGQEGLTPKWLLNTHCHLDHVFGNKFVYDTWALPLHLHELEKPILEAMPEYGRAWEMPFENYRGPLTFLRPGEPIKFGGDELDTLFLPGHSPGSIGFYCRRQGFIIVGDTLFRNSIGRTDLPGGHHETLLKSIRDQLWPLPDETVVYPGHGEPTNIGWEKKHNPFLNE